MNSEIVRHLSPEDQELAQKCEEDAGAAHQENAKMADEEKQTALNLEGTPKEEAGAPRVEIPDTPATQKARAALARAPMDATSVQLDALIRRTATVTSPVRTALVEEEIRRRANRLEDHTRARMMGKPIPTGQAREELQRWATAVVLGEHPYVQIPEKIFFKPEGVKGLTRTPVKGAGAFSGTYYHAKDIDAAEIRKAARDETNPQAALDALVAKFKGEEKPVGLKEEEAEQQDERPPEPTLHSRSILRQKAPQLVTVLVIVAGIAAWLYHSHEVKRRAAEAVEATAEAREQQARSIVTRVRNSWNADDNWEDAFSSKRAAVTPYTIELENALIKGRPIVAFGLVEDLRKSGEQDNSIVLIQDIGRTMKWDLRFSLLSTPAITKAILNDEDQFAGTIVFAATITSVEKISMPLDKNDNDQDYFLAHGILHEAKSIGLWDQPPYK
jgi:hypothetical protein